MKKYHKNIISLVILCAVAAGFAPASAVNWGLSFRNGTNQPPTGEVSAEFLAQYGAYYMGDPAQKTLYLTFDCGYENGNTAKILDTLKSHHVPATFFIVAHYIDSAPDLVRRMTDEGHDVGNHTANHPDMTKVTQTRFTEELKTIADKFQKLTGRTIAPFYRPPEGVFNENNLKQAQSLGYHTTLWSVAYMDWDQDRQPSRASALKTLHHRIHNSAIVLLHVVSSTNAEILDQLLTEWKAKGYRFAALTSLPGMAEPTVTAIPNGTAFKVDGTAVNLCAYELEGSNFVRLRDLAQALAGSDKQFAISYDAAQKRVTLTPGQAYAPTGNELRGAADVAALQAYPARQKVTLEGERLDQMVCNIRDENYIQLRAAAKALDVGVSWDSAANCVHIDTLAGH